MDINNIGGFLHDKTILVTGGSGSIGSELVRQLIQYPIHSVRIFDNNEYSLDKLIRNLGDNSKLRPILGDVRDRDKVRRAIRDCDIIIHCAAIKNINISEYNADEAIETNVNGTLNITRACIYEEPDILCNISTDKAVNPSTLYGCTKATGEYLLKWVNRVVKELKAYSIRLGNVKETRGNVFEIWREQKEKGEPITVTDPNMKRYFINIDDCAKRIIETLPLARGGEIFVPKMQLYEMASFMQDCQHRIIGLREGEKMSEELLSQEELKRAINKSEYWVI